MLTKKVSTNIFPHVIHGAVQTVADIEAGGKTPGTWISRKARKTLRYDLQDASSGIHDSESGFRSRLGLQILDRSHRFGHVIVDETHED